MREVGDVLLALNLLLDVSRVIADLELDSVYREEGAVNLFGFYLLSEGVSIS